MKWRVIVTDSESMTGVAPVCERQNDPTGPHADSGAGTGVLSAWVFDCCPHPQIELWDEDAARWAAQAFTKYDAKAL